MRHKGDHMTLTTPFKFLALAALAFAGLMAAPQAQAQSIGMPCMISPMMTVGYVVYNSGPPNATNPLGLCASEYTLKGINNYLQTGTPQSIAGKAASAAGMSTGLVGQVGLQNKQKSSHRNEDRNRLANEDVRDRALEVEDAITRSIYDATLPVSRRACYSSIGGGAGGGVSGGGASSANGGAASAPQQRETLTPKTESDYVARLVNMPGASDGCTVADYNNKVPGCMNPAGGDLPGVNVSPFILVRNYTGKNGDPSSYTVPNDPGDKFFQAQQGYLTYSKPRPGPAILESVKDEHRAKRFLVVQRRYNSRALAVVGAMNQIAGQTIALPSNSPFINNVWNRSAVPGVPSLREDFVKVYGHNPPDIPSEREIMNLLVLRQFTDTQTGSDMVPDAKEIARRQLEVKKINALLLLKMNEKAEWNNIMYAHILSNRIEPVDREMLVSSATVAN